MDLSSGDCSPNNYFIALNFEILKELVAATSCPDCFEGEMTICDSAEARMGFCHSLELKCTLCTYSKRFRSSHRAKNRMDVKKPMIRDGSKKKTASKLTINPFEINVRFVIGLREIGAGHEAMTTLSLCLNMNCLTPNGYNKIKQSVLVAYKDVAEKSMSRAASEANSVGGDDTAGMKQLRVSIDGSWQKRGHVSKNGVITAVSGDKCVDVEILTKHCNGCKMWNSKKGTPEYQCWLLEHQCEINHSASSGSMESVGAVAMFKRSIEKHNSIYKEYLGDGDTSSFIDVTKANVYKDLNVEPIKLECVGHVQKRLGTRLRNLVKAKKGTDTPLSGKGKLTEKIINSMQNYYGNSIRSNTDNLYAMKKAVYAILFHYTDLPNSSTRHMFCPRGSDSWCKYWALDKKDYIPKSSIPVWIKDMIMPIIKDLQSDDLLSKCLHGQTQNANEALNGVIWSRIPKRVFVGKPSLEMGVYSAVISYNDGAKGVLDVLKCFGLSGFVSEAAASQENKIRINRMKRKSSEKGKKRRKTLRSIKKGFIDEETSKDSYIAGGY